MAAKTVEERLQRIEDILEIYNLMGRYPYYGMASLHWEDKDKTWAKKVPVRIYLGEQGYWEGYDALQKVGLLPKSPEDKENPERVPGMMAMHIPLSPVVEIAGDGKTAKGVWIGMGLLAMKDRETGEPTAAWEWDKYGIDFIKEDGKWKVWHQHIYRLIHGWGEDEKLADVVKKPVPDLSGRNMAPPDGPAVDDNPYRPDTLQQLVPKPPEPYETWDDVEPY
jgi:hypothetical protein